jgi:hypothetical protein
VAKNWIAGATKNKGALHRALGVPEGQKIPAAKLAKAAASKDPLMRKRAQLAETLGKMHSPARDVVAYDETFLGNASVPTVGLVTGNPGTYTNPGTNKIPSTVAQTDGTNSPRVTTTTTMASPNSTPTGKTHWPNVDSYVDKAGEDPGND